MVTARRATAAIVSVLAVVLGLVVMVSPSEAAEGDAIQVLGINDFHGRIQNNGVEAGAAVLAGAVHQLRDQQPNTVFAAAGDLIGASTFGTGSTRVEIPESVRPRPHQLWLESGKTKTRMTLLVSAG